MNPVTIMIRNALARYGSDIDGDGYILRRDGIRTGIKIVQKGRRLRYESEKPYMLQAHAR